MSADDLDKLGPEDRDALAAELALGVVDESERAAAATLAERDPAFRQLVRDWEERLAALSAMSPSVEPPPTLWPLIEAEIGRHRPGTAKPGGILASLWFWRGWAVAATAAALALAAALFLLPPAGEAPGGRYVALLAAPDRPGGFLATVDLAEGQLLVTPLDGGGEDGARVPELWLVSGPAPVSLGLIGGGARLALPSAARQPGVTLAVSLEPPGGSPTGQPTGPVIYQGRLHEIAD